MTDFNWADSENAAREESLPDTLKNGWRYSDPLVASHFNWIFNKVAETFKEKQKAFEVLKEEQNEILKIFNLLSAEQSKQIENLKIELTQTKTVQGNLVRATSRALFTLNSNGLNTKLSAVYPFDEVPDPPQPVRRCLRCNGYHDPDIDYHRPMGS
ncbi:MAG: hypothetical protein BWZ03_00389 [bacterium ADurb.BinA186]|nr:MAG: hypothetical protein BWZ03_00389 [bacterium ADurb.BinA186]